MSRDVITVGLTMRIPLLYQSEYSQWRERFMNYLEEQTDGEAMINYIENCDQALPVIAHVSLAGTAQNALPTLKDPKKATFLYEYETFKAIEGEQLLDTYLRYLQVINDLKKCGYKKDNYGEAMINYIENCDQALPVIAHVSLAGTAQNALPTLKDPKLPNDIYSLIDSNETAKDLWDALERQMQWKQYGTLMRQTKNLMDINIDALYNILKKNQGSGIDDFSELKKIIALLAKAFNRRKFYSKPTNNNLRTSSSSQSANKKQEFVKTDDKKVDKKADEKKRDMSKTKMLLAKKDSDEQVLLAENQAWMESSSDSDQEINANMVFMAQIEKVLSESDESSSSAEETITEVDYYTSESESEYEFETLEYYDNSTNYGLFVNNGDDQDIFHDAIEYAS
nr:hypothetical protein [Tanacetum cinerariifolium]